MSKEDPKSKEEYLRNTHHAYRLFYTVLLTIGLSLGFSLILSEFRPLAMSEFHNRLPILLTFAVFLLIVLRFFLGGVRHLDMTYLENDFSEITESQVSSQRFRLVDIGLLLFNAGLIILMGGLLVSPKRFFAVFALLLLVDGIWGLAISYQMGNPIIAKDPDPQAKWGINNTIHFVLLMVILLFGGWPWLVVIGISNSLFDLGWTFNSYFPPLHG